MATTLTPTQTQAVARMAAAGGRIVLFAGCYWSTISIELHPGTPYPVPTWWVAPGTIWALRRRGLIERCYPDGADRRLACQLTARGWDIARAIRGSMEEKPSASSWPGTGTGPRTRPETPESGGPVGWRGAPLASEGSDA